MKYLDPSLPTAQLLDRCELTAIQQLALREVHGNWVRSAREALGVPAAMLAERLQVSQQAVTKLERSEEQGTISVRRLQELAKAMHCELVYGFVPVRGFECAAQQLQSGLDEARRPHGTRPRPLA